MAKKVFDDTAMDRLQEEMTALSWIGANDPARGAGEIRRVDLAMIDESDTLRLRHPPYPDLDRLAQQILAQGQTTPVFVRPKEGGRFELISGYRRCAALRMIKAGAALARVFEGLNDEQAYDVAISENQDRENLTDLERAEICLKLQVEGKTAQQIATRMGWQGDRQVFRHLQLAKEAPSRLRNAMQERRVSTTVAFTLLEEKFAGLSDALQDEVLRTLAENEMSVREVKAYIARTRKTSNGDTSGSDRTPFIREFKNGSFAIAARLDPRRPEDIDGAIASLEEALKRAKAIKRRIEKERKSGEESQLSETNA